MWQLGLLKTKPASVITGLVSCELMSLSAPSCSGLQGLASHSSSPLLHSLLIPQPCRTLVRLCLESLLLTSLCIAVSSQGDKDFPPAAAQVAHQKPHASIDKHVSPRTQHIQQPRK